jgi:RNA polymerase I-specific transcription initiation factor RRN7
VDLYPITQRLGKIVNYDYAFPSSYSRRAPYLAYPEARLLALLIIAVKLCHPFDGIQRSARSTTEPAAVAVDWTKWTELHDKFEREEKPDFAAGKRNAAEITEYDVFNMSGEELDKYMDWYQKTWVETGRRFGKGENFHDL